MKTIQFLFMIILMLPIPACTRINGLADMGCARVVADLRALTADLEIPETLRSDNPVKTGGEFDVMKYFSVLDHLSIQPGYVLDYVYHFDGMGGYPVLYARLASQPPYVTEADLPPGGSRTSYLDFIQTDDTPESYFQFVALAMMGGQFYLFWHAGYKDSQIVCDKAAVNRIVSSLNGDFGYRISLASWVKALLLQNIGPSVVLGENTVQVRLVTFTNWGGFYEETYTLSKPAPHTITDVQQKNIVPYDCGVMF
jgi:hypothetical protein